MQPLLTTSIRRPFHWGIVIVADAESRGKIPEVEPDKAVSSNEHGIIALVRHAQDIDSFEDEFDWAETEVVVRLLTEADLPSVDRSEVFRGRLKSANGRITVGDADSDVETPAHRGWNELVVTVASDAAVRGSSPDELRIDLIPSV